VVRPAIRRIVYRTRDPQRAERLSRQAADLTAPAFVVEPAAPAGLRAGANVLWQVDVSLPKGERVASPTFITRVE
jgi:hypothetical protein